MFWRKFGKKLKLLDHWFNTSEGWEKHVRLIWSQSCFSQRRKRTSLKCIGLEEMGGKDSSNGAQAAIISGILYLVVQGNVICIKESFGKR